ncbi:MAG: hypothetical protein JJE04_02565 [Acidobacteriia bacterium]|nr:hypothetical protein [Terriglobia bacterium]
MNVLKVMMLTGLLAVSALAGDVTGKWKGTVETPNGSRETVLNLKAEGAKLTGTVSGRAGDTAIQDSKVDGDNVSFSVTRNFGGNEVKSLYKGTLSGAEIKFDVSMGERNFQMVVKRAE